MGCLTSQGLFPRVEQNENNVLAVPSEDLGKRGVPSTLSRRISSKTIALERGAGASSGWHSHRHGPWCPAIENIPTRYFTILYYSYGTTTCPAVYTYSHSPLLNGGMCTMDRSALLPDSTSIALSDLCSSRVDSSGPRKLHGVSIVKSRISMAL